MKMAAQLVLGITMFAALVTACSIRVQNYQAAYDRCRVENARMIGAAGYCSSKLRLEDPGPWAELFEGATR